jgi:hypothetical protein
VQPLDPALVQPPAQLSARPLPALACSVISRVARPVHCPLSMRAPRLSDVLELHDEHGSRKAVSRAAGDAHFYACNPIFTRVRDAALRAGFTYSADGAAHYYGWPLMALDAALGMRRVPFVDNVFQLREIERRRPRHFLLDDLRAYGPAKNPLLHESAHGLAFDALDYDLRPSRPTRLKLTKILLAEAYALAVEKLSGLFVSDSPVELFLHRLNTHVFYIPRRADPIRALHARHGLASALRATIATYLYAGFLYRELGDREIDSILELAGIRRRASASDVEAIFATTFEVGSDFRHRITSNYLRAHGYSRDLLKLVDFEPLAYVQRRAPLRKSLDGLVALVSESA